MFVIGDIFTAAKVLFDKSNVVSYVDETFEVDLQQLKLTIEEFKTRYTQHARVIKYCERNQFLEAYMYYGKYVAEPLVVLARYLYTPKYHYIYMLHISDHMPIDVVRQLESFYKISSVADIKKNTTRSKRIFEEYLNLIKEKYKI